MIIIIVWLASDMDAGGDGDGDGHGAAHCRTKRSSIDV
jgi:hypothetical protein